MKNILQIIFGGAKKKAKKYFELALMKKSQNDFEGALAAYNKAIELNKFGNNANVYYNRGNIKVKLNDFNGSIQDYSSALIGCNSNERHEVYFNRGNSYYDLKRFELAIQDYSNCLQLRKNYSPAYINRALSFIEISEYEKAIPDIHDAIKYDAKELNARSSFYLAISYDNIKQPSKSLFWYESTLKYLTNDIGDFNNLIMKPKILERIALLKKEVSKN
jgi:tetratricopeptide (TPR) repeat protein